MTKPHQLHLCYQLTPPRYLYDTPDGYIETVKLTQIWPFKWLVSPIKRYLRWWDQTAAHRPDQTIAISRTVAARIKHTYGLKSEIIYPPLQPPPNQQNKPLPVVNYLLIMSRLVNYKRFDLAIQAAINAQRQLIIAGTGPEMSHLQQLAGVAGVIRPDNLSVEQFLTSLNEFSANQSTTQVIFLGSVAEQEKWHLLANARVVLMPGQEDFGITGLEAAAMHTPVICHYRSGVAEVLSSPQQAILIKDMSSGGIEEALKKLDESNNPSIKDNKAQKKPFLPANLQPYTTTEFINNFANTTYKLIQKQSTI